MKLNTRQDNSNLLIFDSKSKDEIKITDEQSNKNIKVK